MNGLVYHLPLEMLHTAGGRSNLFAAYIDEHSICEFLCKHLDLFSKKKKKSLLWCILICLIFVWMLGRSQIDNAQNAQMQM